MNPRASTAAINNAPPWHVVRTLINGDDVRVDLVELDPSYLTYLATKADHRPHDGGVVVDVSNRAQTFTHGGLPLAVVKTIRTTERSRSEVGLENIDILRPLNHPGIARYYDVLRYDGKCCVVMEYCQGKTLRQCIIDAIRLDGDEEGRKTTTSPATEPNNAKAVASSAAAAIAQPSTILAIVSKLAEALSYLHETCRVAHCDIKPENIIVDLIDPHAAASQQKESAEKLSQLSLAMKNVSVKIVDFGLAMPVQDIRSCVHDDRARTVLYAAPERMRSLHRLCGCPADVWAFGCVAFELWTLWRPFATESSIKVYVDRDDERSDVVNDTRPIHDDCESPTAAVDDRFDGQTLVTKIVRARPPSCATRLQLMGLELCVTMAPVIAGCLRVDLQGRMSARRVVQRLQPKPLSLSSRRLHDGDQDALNVWFLQLAPMNHHHHYLPNTQNGTAKTMTASGSPPSSRQIDVKVDRSHDVVAFHTHVPDMGRGATRPPDPVARAVPEPPRNSGVSTVPICHAVCSWLVSQAIQQVEDDGELAELSPAGRLYEPLIVRRVVQLQGMGGCDANPREVVLTSGEEPPRLPPACATDGLLETLVLHLGPQREHKEEDSRDDDQGEGTLTAAARSLLKKEASRRQTFVVIGSPGSGKSSMLRWTATTLLSPAHNQATVVIPLSQLRRHWCALLKAAETEEQKGSDQKAAELELPRRRPDDRGVSFECSTLFLAAVASLRAQWSVLPTSPEPTDDALYADVVAAFLLDPSRTQPVIWMIDDDEHRGDAEGEDNWEEGGDDGAEDSCERGERGMAVSRTAPTPPFPDCGGDIVRLCDALGSSRVNENDVVVLATRQFRNRSLQPPSVCCKVSAFSPSDGSQRRKTTTTTTPTPDEGGESRGRRALGDPPFLTCPFPTDRIVIFCVQPWTSDSVMRYVDKYVRAARQRRNKEQHQHKSQTKEEELAAASIPRMILQRLKTVDATIGATQFDIDGLGPTPLAGLPLFVDHVCRSVLCEDTHNGFDDGGVRGEGPARALVIGPKLGVTGGGRSAAGEPAVGGDERADKRLLPRAAVMELLCECAWMHCFAASWRRIGGGGPPTRPAFSRHHLPPRRQRLVIVSQICSILDHHAREQLWLAVEQRNDQTTPPAIGCRWPDMKQRLVAGLKLLFGPGRPLRYPTQPARGGGNERLPHKSSLDIIEWWLPRVTTAAVEGVRRAWITGIVVSSPSSSASSCVPTSKSKNSKQAMQLSISNESLAFQGTSSFDGAAQLCCASRSSRMATEREFAWRPNMLRWFAIRQPGDLFRKAITSSTKTQPQIGSSSPGGLKPVESSDANRSNKNYPIVDPRLRWNVGQYLAYRHLARQPLQKAATIHGAQTASKSSGSSSRTSSKTPKAAGANVAGVNGSLDSSMSTSLGTEWFLLLPLGFDILDMHAERLSWSWKQLMTRGGGSSSNRRKETAAAIQEATAAILDCLSRNLITAMCSMRGSSVGSLTTSSVVSPASFSRCGSTFPELQDDEKEVVSGARSLPRRRTESTTVLTAVGFDANCAKICHLFCVTTVARVVSSETTATTTPLRSSMQPGYMSAGDDDGHGDDHGDLATTSDVEETDSAPCLRALQIWGTMQRASLFDSTSLTQAMMRFVLTAAMPDRLGGVVLKGEAQERLTHVAGRRLKGDAPRIRFLAAAALGWMSRLLDETRISREAARSESSSASIAGSVAVDDAMVTCVELWRSTFHLNVPPPASQSLMAPPPALRGLFCGVGDAESDVTSVIGDGRGIGDKKELAVLAASSAVCVQKFISDSWRSLLCDRSETKENDATVMEERLGGVIHEASCLACEALLLENPHVTFVVAASLNSVHLARRRVERLLAHRDAAAFTNRQPPQQRTLERNDDDRRRFVWFDLYAAVEVLLRQRAATAAMAPSSRRRLEATIDGVMAVLQRISAELIGRVPGGGILPRGWMSSDASVSEGVASRSDSMASPCQRRRADGEESGGATYSLCVKSASSHGTVPTDSASHPKTRPNSFAEDTNNRCLGQIRPSHCDPSSSLFDVKGSRSVASVQLVDCKFPMTHISYISDDALRCCDATAIRAVASSSQEEGLSGCPPSAVLLRDVGVVLNVGTMPRLRYIEDGFAAQCPLLTTVDLADGWGQQLMVIGSYFFADCPSLRTVALFESEDPEAIRISHSNLARLDDGETLPKDALRPQSDGGLSALNRIGHWFFFRNASLEVFSGLSHCTELEFIGSSFFGQCTSLKEIVLPVSMPRLQSLSSAFLKSCRSLASIDLSGCTSVTTIEHDCLSDCTALVSLDLSAMVRLARIGDRFLANASALTTVMLRGLSRLEAIGHDFLRGARFLDVVDLSDCTSLQVIGHSAMRDCASLNQVKFAKSKRRRGGEGSPPTVVIDQYDQHRPPPQATSNNRIRFIGAHFVRNCPSLRTVDLSLLENLEEDHFSSSPQLRRGEGPELVEFARSPWGDSALNRLGNRNIDDNDDANPYRTSFIRPRHWRSLSFGGSAAAMKSKVSSVTFLAADGAEVKSPDPREALNGAFVAAMIHPSDSKEVAWQVDDESLGTSLREFHHIDSGNAIADERNIASIPLMPTESSSASRGSTPGNVSGFPEFGNDATCSPLSLRHYRRVWFEA